jgi:PKD repeat protein
VRKYVTVNPCICLKDDLPTADFDYELMPGCPIPFIVQFIDDSYTDTSQIVEWNWNFGDRNILIGSTPEHQNPKHRYFEPREYEVLLTVTDELGCSNIYGRKINVNNKCPVCDPNFEVESEVCVNKEVYFRDLSNYGDCYPFIWHWDFDNGKTSDEPDPETIYIQTGIYFPSLTVTYDHGEIKGPIRKRITVKSCPCEDPPEADFDADPTYACPGPLTVTFTDRSYNPTDYPITSWTWVFGDGSDPVYKEGPHIHKYTEPGLYTVSLTVANDNPMCGPDTLLEKDLIEICGCEDFISAWFIADPWEGPAPLTVQFTDYSDSEVSIIRWFWNFNDGSPITLENAKKNPKHKYLEPGVYTVSLTVTNECGGQDTWEEDIIVIKCEPDFKVPEKVCKNRETYFDDMSDYGDCYPTAWSWNFGDSKLGTLNTSSLQYPRPVKYTVEGQYTVSLTVTYEHGETKGQITKQITVELCCDDADDFPQAWFDADPLEGPVPLTVQFTDKSLAPDEDPITKWEWVFGDGTILSGNNPSIHKNPKHEYYKPGEYTVSLTVTNECGPDTLREVNLIYVYDLIADFDADRLYGCWQEGGFHVSFIDQSEGEPENWLWNFGDNSSPDYRTERYPVHTYNAPGIYTVSLTVSRSKFSNTKTEVAFIEVEDCDDDEKLEPDFDGDELYGCVPHTVHFTDYTIGEPTSWNWSFGDGSTSTDQNPIHKYTKIGVYTVTLKVKNTVSEETEIKIDYIEVDDCDDPCPEPGKAQDMLLCINIDKTKNKILEIIKIKQSGICPDDIYDPEEYEPEVIPEEPEEPEDPNLTEVHTLQLHLYTTLWNNPNTFTGEIPSPWTPQNSIGRRLYVGSPKTTTSPSGLISMKDFFPTSTIISDIGSYPLFDIVINGVSCPDLMNTWRMIDRSHPEEEYWYQWKINNIRAKTDVVFVVKVLGLLRVLTNNNQDTTLNTDFNPRRVIFGNISHMSAHPYCKFSFLYSKQSFNISQNSPPLGCLQIPAGVIQTPVETVRNPGDIPWSGITRSYEIRNLEHRTTYYYRACAVYYSNTVSVCVSFGELREFTTG